LAIIGPWLSSSKHKQRTEVVAAAVVIVPVVTALIVAVVPNLADLWESGVEV
jgi:hypothetical protein